MRSHKALLRIVPYLLSVLAGLLFYFIGLKVVEGVRDLFINIAAAFLAIPLIYLFYNVAHNYSQRRLNEEIFDYAKMQIDREVLSIVNQLEKIIYPLEEKDSSLAGINGFLSIEEKQLEEILSKSEYLGFQIFRKWELSEENLHDMLRNSFIIARLADEQTISIIRIVKSLRYLEGIQKSSGLYIPTGKQSEPFRIVAGGDLNERNTKFPDRYLLLKELGDGNSFVADFGDFAAYDVSKLLQRFKIVDDRLEMYADAISILIEEINTWVDLTGGEFIIDTKMFRLKPVLRSPAEKHP